MWIKLWKLGLVVAIIATFIAEKATAGGLERNRRSPHKKHKIIVVSEGQQNEGEGWGAPPPVSTGWVAPPPSPPPVSLGWGAAPPEVPPPQQESVIEHHHHHYEVAPSPPPPVSQSHSVVIQVNKGVHGGKFKEDADQIRRFHEEVGTAIEDIERDKQEKIDAFKKDAEAKLDALAQIPHMIAGDIDFIGRKIAEDIERKKQKDEGVSIQIWKGKGTGTVGHTSGSTASSSQETVHHHHYYHDNVQQRPPPPPRQPPPPPPQQPPLPPKKEYYGDREALQDGLYKLADVGTAFIDHFAGGGFYRPPATEQGSIESGGGGWHQGQGGGQGKGIQVRVWKSKGFRRRK